MSILGNFSGFLTSVLALFIKIGVVQEPAAPFKRPAPQDRGGSVGNQKSAASRKKEQTSFSRPHLFEDKPFPSTHLLQSSNASSKPSGTNTFELGEPSMLLRKASKKQVQPHAMNQVEGSFSGDQFDSSGFLGGFPRFPFKLVQLVSSVSPLQAEVGLPETPEEETSNAFVEALVLGKKNLKNTGGIAALELRLQLKKPPVEAVETLQEAKAPARVDSSVPAKKQVVAAPAELEEMEIFEPVVVEKQEGKQIKNFFSEEYILNGWRKYEDWVVGSPYAQKEQPSEPVAPVEEAAAAGPELIEELVGVDALEELFKKYLASRESTLENQIAALEGLEKLLEQRLASRGGTSVANANKPTVTLEDLEAWFDQHLASKKSAPAAKLEEAEKLNPKALAKKALALSKPPVEEIEELKTEPVPEVLPSVLSPKQIAPIFGLDEIEVIVAQEPLAPNPEMKKPALGGLLGDIVSFKGFKKREIKPELKQNSDKDLIAEAKKVMKIDDTQEEIEKEIERLEKLKERLNKAIAKKQTEGGEIKKLQDFLPDVNFRLKIFTDRVANFVEDEMNNSIVIMINNDIKFEQKEEEQAKAKVEEKSNLEKQITKFSRSIEKLEKSKKEEDKAKIEAEKSSLAELQQTYKSNYKHNFIVEPLNAPEPGPDLFSRVKGVQPKEKDLNSSFNSDWD